MYIYVYIERYTFMYTCMHKLRCITIHIDHVEEHEAVLVDVVQQVAQARSDRHGDALAGTGCGIIQHAI